jgi:hypothetical protein
VDNLLDGADPILAAYREHRIGAAAAWRRMNALEDRFAADAVRIADVRHVPAALRAARSSPGGSRSNRSPRGRV